MAAFEKCRLLKSLPTFNPSFFVKSGLIFRPEITQPTLKFYLEQGTIYIYRMISWASFSYIVDAC